MEERFCCDCVHITKFQGGYTHARCEVMTRDAVSKERGFAHISRNSGPCGKEGKFFEIAPVEPPSAPTFWEDIVKQTLGRLFT